MIYECEVVEETFGKNKNPCNNGDVSVAFLKTPYIQTGNRAYQREKVATDSWKQDLMRTVLINHYAGIPEIHIRVIKTESGYRYELIDGQQRVTAILDFLKGSYNLPSDFIVKGCDCSGMNVDELVKTYPAIYELITEYRISCKWYENLSDLETATLFIKILNNVTYMSPQEIRNAILGFYSEYVRNTARFEPHELFTRITTISKGKEKRELKYFSSKFALKNRMEVDEWLSEIIYLWKHGVLSGINHKKHFDWVESIQAATGEYSNEFKDEDEINKFLKFALTILKAVTKEDKVRLNPMTSMMLVLYANELKMRYGSVIPEKYSSAFFKVYDDWSDTDKALYADRETINENQMPPFKELFGGKNPNAIGTIFAILDEEMEKDLKAFGILKIDKRNFKKSDIIKRWKEQGGVCFYTNKPLELDNIAGDHYIPRSSGVENGGVTEYSNLVICSRNMNGKKGNMSAKAFEKLCESEKNKLAEEAA